MRRNAVEFAFLIVALLWTPDALVRADEVGVKINYGEQTGTGSPYVFGGTQPRGLSNAQWDRLQQQGFRFVRSQADLTRLVPCDSLEGYQSNEGNCRDPKNWDWVGGIYGDDFAQRAIDRGMKVCLVIKNARWNRYPNSPDDEETVPRDLEVWSDVVRKIVDHYEGGLSYIELFNEVDRDPQLRVEGSPFSREEAYQQIALAALKAVAKSEHPETAVGGPAAAGTGEDATRWLLSNDGIRKGLGFISFHAFDQLHYPRESVQRLRKLLDEYDCDVPIVRSSFVPEREDATHAPGTTDAVLVAEHLVGALGDGLAACGLWEIQNRSGRKDLRYWFDGDELAPAAALWPLLGQELGLGAAPNRSVAVDADDSVSCYAAQNGAGDRIAVIVVHEPTDLLLQFSGGSSQIKSATVFEVDRSGKVDERSDVEVERDHSGGSLQLSTKAGAVLAIKLESAE